MHFLMRPALPVLALLAAGACGDDVPQSPTWFGEVQAILTSNCARCHGSVTAPGAPPNMRLDRFEDAVAFRDRIRDRAVDYETSGALQMPPDSYLSNEQKEILAIWIDNDTPKGTRELNRRPRAERIEPVTAPDSADQELTIRFRVSDADGDGVISALGWRESDGGGPLTVVAQDLRGIPEFTIDTGVMQDQTRFDIVAILDDGFGATPAENRTSAPILSDLLMDHGTRGTAPTVTLLAPTGVVTKPMSTIAWAATDPDDGDTLSIDIDLVQTDRDGNELSSELLAKGLSNDEPSFAFATADLPEEDAGAPIFYRVRVTATDGGARNRRSADSAPFSLVTLAWKQDIKPLMETYCIRCHGEGTTGSVGYFRLDKYDADDGADEDLGVFEMRETIYEQVVVRGLMPKLTGMNPADKATLAAWLQAGAPL